MFFCADSLAFLHKSQTNAPSSGPSLRYTFTEPKSSQATGAIFLLFFGRKVRKRNAVVYLPLPTPVPENSKQIYSEKGDHAWTVNINSYQQTVRPAVGRCAGKGWMERGKVSTLPRWVSCNSSPVPCVWGQHSCCVVGENPRIMKNYATVLNKRNQNNCNNMYKNCKMNDKSSIAFWVAVMVNDCFFLLIY